MHTVMMHYKCVFTIIKRIHIDDHFILITDY